MTDSKIISRIISVAVIGGVAAVVLNIALSSGSSLYAG